jgi:hypothetical protein
MPTYLALKAWQLLRAILNEWLFDIEMTLIIRYNKFIVEPLRHAYAELV